MGDQPLRRTGTARVPKPLPHMMSRWYGGVSTFGPLGRIGWTLLTFSVPAWMVYLALVDGLVAIVIDIPVLTVWFGWLIPLMMRDIWAKDAFYVPRASGPDHEAADRRVRDPGAHDGGVRRRSGRNAGR